MFHWKLAKILLWHRLQTEEKTTIFLTYKYCAWRFPSTSLHITTIQSLASYVMYSQTNYVSLSCFWSIDKCLAHKMTWLHAYLNYSRYRIEFSTSSSYLVVHYLYKYFKMYCHSKSDGEYCSTGCLYESNNAPVRKSGLTTQVSPM